MARQFTCMKMVTHPSSNPAYCRSTLLLIDTDMIPLKPRHHTVRYLYSLHISVDVCGMWQVRPRICWTLSNCSQCRTMQCLTASRRKCSSVVCTPQLSLRLRTGAASRCRPVATVVSGRHQCTTMRHLIWITAAFRLRHHHAGHSHSLYHRPRAMLPARYTALQICTTAIPSCRVAQLHATLLRTAWNTDPQQHWMLRRTVGKDFRAYLSRDRGTYLEHRCGTWLSLLTRLWNCRLITHTLNVTAPWWIGNTKVLPVLCSVQLCRHVILSIVTLTR